MDLTCAPVDMNNNHFWSPQHLQKCTKTIGKKLHSKTSLGEPAGYDVIKTLDLSEEGDSQIPANESGQIGVDTESIVKPSNNRE
jgi:hypothetical protein